MKHVHSITVRCSNLFLAVAGPFLALAVPAAARPEPLDRIAIVRLTAEADGKLRRHNAVLHDDGRVTPRNSYEFPRPGNTPARALGRNLVLFEAWLAYTALEYNALARFSTEDGGNIVEVGDDWYVPVALNPDSPRDAGRLINLSARHTIGGAAAPALIGFVIEGESRTVLIRAVGPTLQRFGVAAPAADPFLSVQRRGTTIFFNDNWGDAAEAAAIREAAARAGAFPLDAGSRDAARLIELPPGAYTLAVQSAGVGPAGEVLVEIYSVPAAAPDSSSALDAGSH